MEEKKKIIKMPLTDTPSGISMPAPSKEEVCEQKLKMIQAQWMNEKRQLINELNRLSMVNTFKRLDYLFEVIKNYANFSTEFVDACVEEITSTMNEWKRQTEPSNEEVPTENQEGTEAENVK